MYDQTKDKSTGYACVFFGFINILYYKFGIKLSYAWVYKFVGMLKYAGVLLTWGAVTGTLYSYCTSQIRKKTGLNFVVQTASISKGNLKDGEYYGVGIKNLSTFYKKLASDGRITREEIDSINLKKGAGHHIMFRKGDDTVVDSYGNFKYHLPFENLQYWVKTGFAYDTARALIPDERTKKVLGYLESMKKGTYKWDLHTRNPDEVKMILQAGRIYRQDYAKLA